MKVILNTDLEGKGDLGDIVEVKPGFARNYLFPKELALPVSKQNLEMMKARRKKVEKELEIQRLSATEQKVKLEELSLTFGSGCRQDRRWCFGGDGVGVRVFLFLVQRQLWRYRCGNRRYCVGWLF